jgi:hypothetical protein
MKKTRQNPSDIVYGHLACHAGALVAIQIAAQIIGCDVFYRFGNAVQHVLNS